MIHSSRKVPVAVIGAGPAGLAASNALSQEGVHFIVYETGKGLSERQRDISTDLVSGVGGAGLFSDGKFSYYPSGTHVYRLEDQDKLKKAYHWLSQQLRLVDIEFKPFPREISEHGNMDKCFREKKYPSYDSSLQQRRLLVAQLSHKIERSLVTNARVCRVVQTPDGYLINFLKNDSTNLHTNRVSAIVLATGKLGGLDLTDGRLFSPIPLKETRYEFGIRIECHHSIGFLNRNMANDVKYLWKCGPAQFRTFCTCRRGEIWNIPYDGLSVISGRREQATDYSNFGVLARFEGQELKAGRQFWSHLRTHLPHLGLASWEPLSSFLQDRSLDTAKNIRSLCRPWFPPNHFQLKRIRTWLGQPLYLIFKTALNELLVKSPDLLDEQTICLFPAIEGTGLYPDTDQNLKARGYDIWSAGDVVGRFRGLVPALLSGYYAALDVSDTLGKQR